MAYLSGLSDVKIGIYLQVFSVYLFPFPFGFWKNELHGLVVEGNFDWHVETGNAVFPAVFQFAPF